MASNRTNSGLLRQKKWAMGSLADPKTKLGKPGFRKQRRQDRSGSRNQQIDFWGHSHQMNQPHLLWSLFHLSQDFISWEKKSGWPNVGLGSTGQLGCFRAPWLTLLPSLPTVGEGSLVAWGDWGAAPRRGTTLIGRQKELYTLESVQAKDVLERLLTGEIEVLSSSTVVSCYP